MLRMVLRLLFGLASAETVQGSTCEAEAAIACTMQHVVASRTLRLRCFDLRSGRPVTELWTSEVPTWNPNHMRNSGSWQQKADVPVIVSRAADHDTQLLLVRKHRTAAHHVLVLLHVDLAAGRIEVVDALDLPSSREVQAARGARVAQLDEMISPTALLGFADGRVFVGYPNHIIFADLRSKHWSLLHDFSHGSPGKHVDAFASNGEGVVVAVDDTVSPKWLFVFDASQRIPRLLNTVSLRESKNQHYMDAVFLAADTLVLLDRFGHRAGEGHTLHFLKVAPSGDVSQTATLQEFQPRKPMPHNRARTLVGDFTHVRKMEASSRADVVLAAETRGLLVLPRDAFSEDEAYLISTAYASVDVHCRGNSTIALLAEPVESSGKPRRVYHAAIFDGEMRPLLTAPLLFESSSSADDTVRLVH